jgi:hypothetical protein
MHRNINLCTVENSRNNPEWRQIRLNRFRPCNGERSESGSRPWLRMQPWIARMRAEASLALRFQILYRQNKERGRASRLSDKFGGGQIFAA